MSDYSMIPQDTIETIDRYVKDGCSTGDFLYAVMTNDLFESIRRADKENGKVLVDICRYIYNEIPSNCWGDKETVAAWMKKKYEEREALAQVEEGELALVNKEAE